MAESKKMGRASYRVRTSRSTGSRARLDNRTGARRPAVIATCVMPVRWPVARPEGEGCALIRRVRARRSRSWVDVIALAPGSEVRDRKRRSGTGIDPRWALIDHVDGSPRSPFLQPARVAVRPNWLLTEACHLLVIIASRAGTSACLGECGNSACRRSAHALTMYRAPDHSSKLTPSATSPARAIDRGRAHRARSLA